MNRKMRLREEARLEITEAQETDKVRLGNSSAVRSVSHICDIIVEFGCLAIYCCIAHYSQRRYISLVVSYMKEQGGGGAMDVCR